MVAPAPKYVTYNNTYGVATQRPILEPGDAGWRPTFESIPIISFAKIDGTLEERKELAKEVGEAFREVGFMYAKDCPGVSEELVAETFRAIKEFFDKPMDKKMEVHWNKSTAAIGYEPFDAARLGVGAKVDMRESFCISDDMLDPEQHYPHPPPSGTLPLNQWPSSYPPLRTQLYTYFDTVYPLARSLLKILALALELDENAFEETYQWPIWSLRAHHYLPRPVTEEGPSLGAHADFSSFTFVCQEPGSGSSLEVLNLNGKWISAPPLPYPSFVINCGDYLERTTAGTFVSTVHRVFNHTGLARYSLPFFISPDPDSVVKPLIGVKPKEGEEGKWEGEMNVGQHYAKRLFQSRREHPTAKWLKARDAPVEEYTYDLMRYGIPE